MLAGIVLIAAVIKFGDLPQRANASTNIAPLIAPADAAPEIIDLKAALAPRIMGDENAPVTIEEFASLTCSHCAHFNKETFSALKEKYIDTGKVKFIYNDFPLNAPALEAAMVARCLPEARYFQFIKFLFETQDQWAFNKDYSASLKQNSKLLGLNDESYEACVENEALKGGLAQKMQEAGKKHEIKSTPSFVINGTEKINGAQPLAAFEKVIDRLLEAN